MMRRAERLHGAQPGLPPARADGTGGIEIPRQQIFQLEQEIASLLSQHQEAVLRLAQVPGLEWLRAADHCRSGGQATRFPSEKHLCSWVGACLEMKRTREYPRTTASPRAIDKCGASSINAPTLQCGRKEASSRSCIAASYYAWDTIRPSGQLPIGFVG
jgi:transposase